MDNYDVMCNKWKSDKGIFEVGIFLYSDICSEYEEGRAMTNKQKVGYVMGLRNHNYTPLFRFLYNYVAELRDKCLSIRAKAKEQYMEYPHLYDKLIEEASVYFSTRLDVSFDIDAFRHELMRK